MARSAHQRAADPREGRPVAGLLPMRGDTERMVLAVQGC
jgi:hypothetical protein